MKFAFFVIIAAIVVLTVAASNSVNTETFNFISDPQLKRGDRFYIKTIGGGYVSVCSDCQPIDQNLKNQCASVLCVKPKPLQGSVWVYQQHDDGTFSVISDVTGLAWKRCNNCVENCPNIICSDGINSKLQSAKFELVKLGSNRVSIKTDIGTYLDLNECSQQCGKVVSGVGSGIFILEPLPRRSLKNAKQTAIVPVKSYAPIVIPYNA